LGGKEGSPELTRQDSPAVICVEMLTPKDVLRRTGFDNITQPLSYVAVVCGGDVGLMTLRQSVAGASEGAFQWVMQAPLLLFKDSAGFSTKSDK
jgi:hypothetical protein